MLNIIWFLMILTGVTVAFVNGTPEVITAAAFNSAVNAVDLVFNMTGIIMLWMGILKIAEKSGLVNSLSRLLQPILGRLFPDLPKNCNAMGSIVMNVGANLLGLGNAATPFGLKAMIELNKLNNNGKTASDDMITFLILNTSALTFVPTMIIGMRKETGSFMPEEIIMPAFIAAFCGLTAGLVCHKVLKKFF